MVDTPGGGQDDDAGRPGQSDADTAQAGADDDEDEDDEQMEPDQGDSLR